MASISRRADLSTAPRTHRKYARPAPQPADPEVSYRKFLTLRETMKRTFAALLRCSQSE